MALKPVCPLCSDSTAGHRVLSITQYRKIWEELSIEWGAKFSLDLIDRHTPAPTVSLCLCSACGLQYFFPAVPGSAEFYAQLTSSSPNYYNEDKWEFQYVRNLLKRDDKVLDVACGYGAFLRSISDLVAECTGLDTNPDACISADRVGIAILNRSILDYCRLHSDRYDVVTAFQVIEHLDQVMPFAAAAFECVRPGGLLVLSVPNRDRRRDHSFGSLDHPPHHLSRWDAAQLTSIANRLGGKVSAVVRQPLTRAQTVGALRHDELPALVPVAFPWREAVFKVISRALLSTPINWLWDYLDMNARLEMYGMSLVVAIRK